MRLMGFVLLISGFAIAVAAVFLFGGIARFGFVTIALAIEALGLGLVAYGYKSLQMATPRARGSR